MILTVTNGFILHKAKSKYKFIIFTIHKLTATAFVVFVVLSSIQYSIPPIFVIVLGGLSIITLFTTGVLLTRKSPNRKLLINLHKMCTITALTATIVFIYFQLS